MNRIKIRKKTTEGRKTLLALVLFIICATFLLGINSQNTFLPAEIVLNGMINALINVEFILITISNLKVINASNDKLSAITVIIGQVYLIPMITICFLSIFIKATSISKKIIIFSISLVLHTIFIYLYEYLGLINIKNLPYYFSVFYWCAVLLVNLFIFFKYRKLLARAGMLNGYINNANKF